MLEFPPQNTINATLAQQGIQIQHYHLALKTYILLFPWIISHLRKYIKQLQQIWSHKTYLATEVRTATKF